MQGGFAADRLIFARTHQGHFQIGSSALAALRQYIQDAPEKVEAGGILLGRHIAGTENIIVDDITVPMQGDQRSRFHFFRSRKHHQEAINRAWQESSGTCIYLGEWHTHPQSNPTPSLTDQTSWQQKFLADQFTKPIFFVIVGISTVCVWEGYGIHRLMQLSMM